MKKILLIVGAFSFASSLLAQEFPNKKRPTLVVNFMLNDFKTPTYFQTGSLVSVINKKQFTKFKNMDPGLNITYIDGIYPKLDFVASFGGSFTRYPFKNQPTPASDRFLMEGDANVNLRLLEDHYVFNPFVSGGVGISYYDAKWGAYLPAGVGVQFKLSSEEIVRVQAQYRVGITEMTSNHFNYSVGIGFPLTEKKEVKVKPAPVVPAPVEEKDTDGDGIMDSNDQCPTVKGVAKYNGCPVPDSDNDGLADDVDKCPTVAGLAKYNGCPVPDSDKDGINDEDDNCPMVAGFARYKGCPVPDTDKDGLNDEEDKCPTVAGPASNNGCPEAPKEEEVKQVTESAKLIYFETGSAKLKTTSYPALDRVIKVMKSNTTATLSIEGHTDNTGDAVKNQKLSEDRAKSVKAYLVKKGIEETRLEAKGFGDTKPVASNATAAGKAKNRRVVLQLQ